MLQIGHGLEAGRLALGQVEVGRTRHLAARKQGVERQLRFLAAGPHALVGVLLPLGLVVDQQFAAAGRAVDAVDAPAQLQRAAAHADVVFGALEHMARGLVPGQPRQVFLAQAGPRGLERQKFARLVGQALLLRDLRGGRVHQGGAIGLRRVLQRLMKVTQHRVHPIAPIAGVDIHVELAFFLQAQLAQRKKAIGAGAQLLVAAGRQRLRGQGAAHGLRARGGRGGHGARGARIGRVGGDAHATGGARQLQGLHQGRGQQGLAAVVAVAPQHVNLGHAQHRLPGGVLGALQIQPRRQVQVRALRRAPGAAGLGGGGQALLVGAGQHQRGKRPAQQLGHGQHDHRRIGGQRRTKGAGLQRLADPMGEIGQVHAALRDGAGGPVARVGAVGRRQPDGGQHGAARRVGRERAPQATGLQQCLRGLQPGRHGARAGQGCAQRLDAIGERHRAQHVHGLRPVAHGLAAQRVLDGAQRQRIKRGGQLEPVQHGIAAGLGRAGAQRRHQGGAGVRGRELPARLVAQRQAACGQQRIDTARERAIARHQRHRHAARRHVAQHAGGRALGFVLGVQAAMQGRARAGRCGRQRQVRELFKMALGQGVGQRIVLQAGHDHQRVQRAHHARLEQHVAGVVRVAHPGQGNARQLGFFLQRAFTGRRQGGTRVLHPVGPHGRRQAGGQRGQFGGQLQQGLDQQRALACLAGGVQQAGGHQPIAPALAAPVAGAGCESAHALRPGARGFKARRVAVGKVRGPLLRRQRQQLRIGQQHHAARRVGGLLAQRRVDARQQRGPGGRRGIQGAKGIIRHGLLNHRRVHEIGFLSQ